MFVIESVALSFASATNSSLGSSKSQVDIFLLFNLHNKYELIFHKVKQKLAYKGHFENKKVCPKTSYCKIKQEVEPVE